VRDGHTVAQTGRTQAFAREEAVGDQRPVETVQGFKQQAGFFESAFFCSWRPR